MSTSAKAAGDPAVRLGFTAGQVVQEFGYDSDVTDDFRFSIEDLTTSELEDEDFGEVADAVLLWWRDGDGDLTDALVDALTQLADGGFIVLMTPKAGHPEQVDPSEIEEAALTAGLQTSSSVKCCEDWTGTRLIAARR